MSASALRIYGAWHALVSRFGVKQLANVAERLGKGRVAKLPDGWRGWLFGSKGAESFLNFKPKAGGAKHSVRDYLVKNSKVQAELQYRYQGEFSKLLKNAKINERSVGGEIRYHLKNILG